MRRVGREEAERLIGAVRPGAVPHEARMVGIRPDLADEVDEDEDETPDEVYEVEFVGGGSYAWSWATRPFGRPGAPLWCTRPEEGDVLCVRGETTVGSPEVLRMEPRTLRVLGSRFARPQPTVLDPGVVAPADVTQGTGMTEDEALLVLRTHHEQLVRSGRQRLGGSLGSVPVFGSLLWVLHADDPIFLGLFGAAVLGTPAWAAASYLGPGLRRRRRLTRTTTEGFCEPVEVTRWWGPREVNVRAADGRSWAWNVRPEQHGLLRAETRMWATPLREGGIVHLVGLGGAGGVPTVVEGFTPARPTRPPRAGVQDVVR